MQVAIYWSRAEGAHPNASVELTERCWPIMYRQLQRHGYDLTLLTKKGENVSMPHDYRIDFDIADPSFCMLSREAVWAEFLREHVEPDEQVVMVEPDTFLRKKIPALHDDCWIMLLARDRKPTPMCFRLCRGRAHSIYSQVVERMQKMPLADQIWNGDAHAMDAVLDLADPMRPHEGKIGNVEVRNWRDYCMEQHTGSKDPVAWTFNGMKGKERMLRLA